MHQTKRELLHSIGLLILRFGFGAFMASHGWGKVQMVFNGQFEDFGDPLGIGKTMSLVLAAGAEFACAILVAIGLLTRVAAVPIVFAMGVAAFLVHGSDPWTMGGGAERFFAGESQSWGSKEPALLFAIAFLTIIFTGPGRFSVDALIFRPKRV